MPARGAMRRARGLATAPCLSAAEIEGSGGVVTLLLDNGSSLPRESWMSIKRNAMIYVFNMNNSSAQHSHLVLSSSGWGISGVQGNIPRGGTEGGETCDSGGTSSL